jgi:hypothetical protein
MLKSFMRNVNAPAGLKLDPVGSRYLFPHRTRGTAQIEGVLLIGTLQARRRKRYSPPDRLAGTDPFHGDPPGSVFGVVAQRDLGGKSGPVPKLVQVQRILAVGGVQGRRPGVQLKGLEAVSRPLGALRRPIHPAGLALGPEEPCQRQ